MESSPSVVMRVQDGEEEDAHPGPGAARVQRDEGHAHGLVEGDERHHGDGPHDEGVAGGVEVHVLVAPGSGLVSGWKIEKRLLLRSCFLCLTHKDSTIMSQRMRMRLLPGMK